MKNSFNQIFVVVKVLILMFMVSKADAGIDLKMTVDSASYTPDGNGDFTVGFTVTNIGTTPTSSSVSMFIATDMADITAVNLTNTGAFSCGYVTSPVLGYDCFGSFIASMASEGGSIGFHVVTTNTTNIPLPFSISTTGDTIATNDQVTPTVILAPDLLLNSLTNPADITTFTPNVTTSFQLENMNTNVALESDVKLEVTFDDNNFTFIPAATVSPPLWNCGVSMANTVTCDCTSSSCTSGIGLNIQYDFSLDFSSNTPIASGNYTFGAGLIYQGTHISGVSSSQTVIVNLTPTDFSIIKIAEDGIGNIVSNVNVNDSFNYKLAIQNTGIDAPTNQVKVIDVLPAGVNFSGIAPTPAGWGCTASGAGNKTIECINSVPLISGAPASDIIIPVTAGSTLGSVTNSANVTPNVAPLLGVLFTDTIASNDSSNAAVTINAAPPVIQSTSLSVQKTALQNGVQVTEVEKGSSFQYEVIVTTTGNFDVYSLSIIDTMPQGVIVNNIVTPPGMTCNNQAQVYNCNYPQVLPTNTSLQIIYDVTDVSDVNTTSLLNSVRVVSFNASEKSDEVIVDLTDSNSNPPPNTTNQYSIQIVDDVDPVEQGEDYNYTVTLKNTGTALINAIDVDVLLPQDLSINSFNVDGVVCNALSTGLSCNASALSLSPGQEMDVVVINVVSDDYFGDVFVEASAQSANNGTASDNETTTILEKIVVNADLSVAILNDTMADQGSFTQFDIQVQNIGTSDAVQPAVVVDLTGLLESVVVSQNSQWDCDVNGTHMMCTFVDSIMPIGHSSLIHITANLTQVAIDAEDITIVATVASNTQDMELANNTATSTISVQATPTEGEILGALQSALNGQGNQQTNKAIENVASYCEVDYFKALEGLCSTLYQTALDGDGETINNVMEQITPNEVIGQSTSIAEIATAQFRNVGSRLSQLRAGGGSGFSSAGLNATYGNGSIPLGMLSYLNKSVDESKDIDVNNDFISPWGFFINGTISMGSRDATGRELGFDFDSYGLTAGVDYRLSANKVIGVALGYANFDSEIDNKATLGSTGVTLTGYGSFYVNDNFYVDARISVAKPDFDQSRKIDFSLGNTTISRVADGSTSGGQYTVAMSAGYNFYKNSWSITPNGSFRYIKTTIDGFTETGAGGFNFSYSDQDLESMIWSAGIKVSKAVSLKNGVITPQFDFDYNYESLNDGNDIEARFVAAPLGEVFIIETDSPDRTYGSAGLGFAYISSNGKQAYINYRSVLGLEGFSRGTFNLGARFEF